MSVTITLPTKAPSEELLYTFDFSGQLDTNDTIVSAVITVSMNKGFDPGKDSLLSGANVVTSDTVSQEIQGGILNNIYNIKVLATTTLGRVLEQIGVLTINE